MTATPIAPPILALDSVSLSFGGVQVLREISFAVKPDSICGIIGPNGAGKSALLNIVSGLYRPDAGRVAYDGVAHRQMRVSTLGRSGIARTFQNLALFPSLNVRENVQTGLRAHRRAGAVAEFLSLPHARRDTAWAASETRAALDLLQLASHADRAAGTLSYGLQKRVELARALVGRPRLLLLDEPFAGMEAEEKHEMAALIRTAHAERGGAILLIEHDIGLVLDLADYIIVLDHGQLIADDTPAVIRENPTVLDAYLGAGHDQPIRPRERQDIESFAEPVA